MLLHTVFANDGGDGGYGGARDNDCQYDGDGDGSDEGVDGGDGDLDYSDNDGGNGGYDGDCDKDCDYDLDFDGDGDGDGDDGNRSTLIPQRTRRSLSLETEPMMPHRWTPNTNTKTYRTQIPIIK